MIKVDFNAGWEPIPQTRNIFSKLLSGDFDEAGGSGYRTRIVRFEPGGETFEPFSHAYWEEAYILEGALKSKIAGKIHPASSYVIRPPGTLHGPFISETGCLMLEMQYFATRAVGFRLVE